jgi:hypothetical protein
MVLIGATVTLDGSGSHDPDGDKLTYKWTMTSRPDGSGAALTGAQGVAPTFVADLAGEYLLSLVVNDGANDSKADEVKITVGDVQNRAPKADAGADQTSLVGTSVPLDGSASSDADGDALTYRWSFVSIPDGSAAELSDASSVKPTFIADKVGAYQIQLIVNDDKMDSDPDVVIITTGEISNTAPIADAGADQEIIIGSTVSLSGLGSSDSDGDPLRYSWSLISFPEGNSATLNEPTLAEPSFTPNYPGIYVVQLIVNDTEKNSAPDTMLVIAREKANTAPTASAGEDRSVFVGAVINLDGSGSNDPDGDSLTYRWSILTRPEGSVAELTDSASTNPSFTVDVSGEYVAQLIVNDGKIDSEPDSASFSATADRPPVVNVGAAFVITQGESLSIPVTGDDPDGDVVTLSAAPGVYNASFSSTPGSPASGAFVFTPSAEQAGVYAVQFVARDAMGLADRETVQITVAAVNHTPILSVPASVTVDEGQSVAITLTASDSDGDALTLTATPLPDNALFVPPTGTITFAPSYDQAGEYDISCEASDGELSSGVQTIHVVVNNIAEGGTTTKLELDVVNPESPSLLKQVRVTGVVNKTGELPDPQQITSSLITGLSPAQGSRGATLDVALTGMSAKSYGTHFASGESVADFGAGISVNSLTVNGAASAVANVTISDLATLGVRAVRVTTGSEIAVSVVAFNVVMGVANLTGVVLDPDTGKPLASAIVSIEGTDISATTDENGRYTLMNVPSGIQTLIINAADHSLIRVSVNAQVGQTTDVGESSPEPTVFDPNSPPEATTFSVTGRLASDVLGEIEYDDALKVVEDAMLLVGGDEAGVLDEYGNQLNTEIEGAGLISDTQESLKQVADDMTRAESVSLQELLHAVSFGFNWANGPLDLEEWIDSLQATVDEAWKDPTARENALVVLVFNKGDSITLSAPELSPDTRLNALQAHLFLTSLVAYVVKTNDAIASDTGGRSTGVAVAKNTGEKANTAPVAVIAPVSSVEPNVAVTLDGSASRDVDGNTLTYSWSIASKPSGSSAPLTNPTSYNPTFTPDVGGNYVIWLVVNDGTESSAPAVITVKVSATTPTANAGADQIVKQGATVSLDGSASSDPNGKTLTFIWSFESIPSGSAAILTNSASDAPTFIADCIGKYIVKLVVNNGDEDSQPDSVVVRVGSSKPIADAGSNRKVSAPGSVRIDGSKSGDPQGREITYAWTLTSKPQGSIASIGNPTEAAPVLVTDKTGNYVAQLIVSNGVQSSDPDSVTVSVGASNDYFTGYWRGFFEAKSAAIELSFAQAAIEDIATMSRIMCVANGGDLAGAYVGSILAGEASDEYSNALINNNISLKIPEPPTNVNAVAVKQVDGTQLVEITFDRSLAESNDYLVELDGGGSFDPDGDSLTYRWEFESKPDGSSATIKDSTAKVTSFYADKLGEYIVRLNVYDGKDWGIADYAYITAVSQSSGKSASPQNKTFAVAVKQTAPKDGNGIPLADAGPNQTVIIGSAIASYEYNLYRFTGDPNVDRSQRDLVARRIFEAGEEAIFNDPSPLSGCYFYAINVTRYTAYKSEIDDDLATNSWWPVAFRGGLTVFKAGARRLTSDYSDAASVYVGPGDFAATLDGVEPGPDASKHVMYYSDSSAGKFLAVADDGVGERTLFANAGFKASSRDGRTIVQYGLAVDNDGNIYSDNAASDDLYGGRVFRFSNEDGSKEFCGSLNYFSQTLMFANPVYSGPMVIRPGARDFNGISLVDNLIVAENLSQRILQIPVNASWDAYRRVGQPYATIPEGGWGRVVDMEFDDADVLYILDGWRVLKVKDGAISVVAYFSQY